MESDRLHLLSGHWDNRAQREPLREQQDPNKTIHTDMLFRMIKRHLLGPDSVILDVGGRTGRFSLPLAKLGHDVTHTDISDEMLRIAADEAQKSGIRNVSFSKASVTDLSIYPDRFFGLVLCFDAPVSSCHVAYPEALDELTRVADRKLILSVFNRSGIILGPAVDFDMLHFGRLNTVWEVFRSGNPNVTPELLRLQGTLMPSWHAFTPKELVAELAHRGFQCRELCAPGTLTRFVRRELLERIIQSSGYQDYLDFEEEFDSQESLLGVGSGRASGLAMVAERTGE